MLSFSSASWLISASFGMSARHVIGLMMILVPGCGGGDGVGAADDILRRGNVWYG